MMAWLLLLAMCVSRGHSTVQYSTYKGVRIVGWCNATAALVLTAVETFKIHSAMVLRVVLSSPARLHTQFAFRLYDHNVLQDSWQRRETSMDAVAVHTNTGLFRI